MAATNVTVNGANFGFNASLISVAFAGVTISPVTLITSHSSFSFLAPARDGLSTSVRVNTSPSLFLLLYICPFLSGHCQRAGQFSCFLLFLSTKYHVGIADQWSDFWKHNCYDYRFTFPVMRCSHVICVMSRLEFWHFSDHLLQLWRFRRSCRELLQHAGAVSHAQWLRSVHQHRLIRQWSSHCRHAIYLLQLRAAYGALLCPCLLQFRFLTFSLS